MKAIRRRIRTLSTAEQGPPPKQASRRASTVPPSREEKTLSRSVSQKKLSQTPARSEQSIASDKGPSVKRHETRLRIARDRAAWAKQKASNSDVHEEIVMEEGSPKHSVDPLPAQAKIARRTASHSPRRSHAPIQQDREVQELKDAHALIRRMLGLRQDDDLISAIRHMTDVVLALGGMQIVCLVAFISDSKKITISISLWMRSGALLGSTPRRVQPCTAMLPSAMKNAPRARPLAPAKRCERRNKS